LKEAHDQAMKGWDIAQKREIDATARAEAAESRITKLEAEIREVNADWGREFYRATAAEARIAQLEAALREARVQGMRAALDAHIGAVLAEAAERTNCGCQPDRSDCLCESGDITFCFRDSQFDVLSLRPTALAALDRAKREARVEGMRAALDACSDVALVWAHECRDATRALIEAERGEGEP